ncbi:MAG: hypothetical protein P4L84_21245 [Isosphaeraceae bacterium]|nr:hypothetical protein [Isosphaeraceae bacterium]
MVLRYIEANPLRATMFANPVDYSRSCYTPHGLGRPDLLLSEFPAWEALSSSVVEPQCPPRGVTAPPAEVILSTVRESILTDRPYTSKERVESRTPA